MGSGEFERVKNTDKNIPVRRQTERKINKTVEVSSITTKYNRLI